MITDPCNCGIMPASHAHVVNSQKKDEVIFWKGAPIINDKIVTKDLEFKLNDPIK